MRLKRSNTVFQVRDVLGGEHQDMVSVQPEIKESGNQSLFLSTGSTLLNLALSDNPYWGFKPGKMFNIVGDSAAGKTFLLWSIFAEAAHNKAFKNHAIYYDEPETALEFNINKLFGKKTEEKVNLEISSDTIEDFHDNLIKVVKKPIIYGLDSFDALSSEAELKRDIREGSYKMEKPKLGGEILRKVVGKIDDSESLLFIISQAKEKIGITFGFKKTRAGGKWLDFYSSIVMFLAVESHIRRKNRDVGINALIKVTKNKQTGKLRTVGFPIYYDYGIDDSSSMIEWLIEEKIWKKESIKRESRVEDDEDKEDKKKSSKIANDFTEAMTFDNLANYFDENKDQLVKFVAEKWMDIERSIATEKKPKYE